MPAEGAYKITIGASVFEHGTDSAVVDWNVLHVNNYGSEAWVEIEMALLGAIAPGQLFKVELVEWGSSTLKQWFYGMVYDILPAGPDALRILARDKFEYIENVDADSFFAGTIHEIEEQDIEPGTTGNKPYALTATDYDDVVLPVVRVQDIQYGEDKTRPEDITGLTPSVTTISQANTKKWAATRFIAEHERLFQLRWWSNLDAFWTMKILRENPDTGHADFSETVFTSTGNTGTGTWRFNGLPFPQDHTFRLNKGQAYWLLIGPDNPALAYNFQFHSYPAVQAIGDTGKGVMTNINASDSTTWVWDQQDKIGYLQIQWLEWQTLAEIDQYDIVEDSGTGYLKILFGGLNAYNPTFVHTGSDYRKGCRLFFLEGAATMQAVLTFLCGTKGNALATDLGSLTIPQVIAFSTNPSPVIREICEAYGYQLRQLHRDETPYSPPRFVADYLPSFGSPVLTLKFGLDSSSPDTEARVINDNLMKRGTTIFTGIRITGQDRDGRLLYHVRPDYDLEKQFDEFSISGAGAGLRKCRLLSFSSVEDIDEFNSISTTLLDNQQFTWEGPLEVDGWTWIVPGKTISYQNSRKGIPTTEFRVTRIEALPNRMIITINSLRDDLAELFRRVELQLGEFRALQSLKLSQLTHQFYAHGREDNAAWATATEAFRARLWDSIGSVPVSSYAPAYEMAGPTINGTASKILYFYFPPEGGDEGVGRADNIKIWRLTTPTPQTQTVGLDNPIYHWADNGCAVSILIYDPTP